MGSTDTKKSEGLAPSKHRRSEWKSRKHSLEKLDFKNWEKLTQKMRRTDGKPVRTDSKNEEDWLNKWEGVSQNKESSTQ